MPAPARVSALTDNTVLLVTFPQAPVTSTQYSPLDAGVTPLVVKLLAVSPTSTSPSLTHTYVSPVPVAVLVNVTLAPSHTVWLGIPAPANVGALTVSVALLVALPHAPVTSTV